MKLWILRDQVDLGPFFTTEENARQYLRRRYQHCTQPNEVAESVLKRAVIVETDDPKSQVCVYDLFDLGES